MFLKLKKIISLLALFPKFKPRIFFHLISKASEPLPNIAKLKNQWGSFSGLENDAAFQFIKAQGINEKHFEELAHLLIKKDWNVVDLGANIGSHSILLSRLVSEGKVFSFEPQSLTFSLLQNNLLLNLCENVFAYKFAISDTELKTVSMEVFSYSGAKTIRIANGTYINNGAVSISQNATAGDLTISKRLDDLDLPPIKFIKIDIQGSEVGALNGAKKTIARYRPTMFIEIEELRLRSLGTSSKELIELLLEYNYVLFRIKTNYPCDHICVPQEKVDEFSLSILKKFNYECERIEGKKVKLFFRSMSDQNYEKIEIIKH